MTFTIDRFKAFAAGLVRPNQFKAKIFVPAFLDGIEATNLTDILIESTSLPSRDLGVIDLPSYGGSILKLAGDEVYSDWTCTIVADGGMVTYKAFERWMEFIKSPTAGTRANDLSYLSVIELRLLDGAKSTFYTKELTGAFPISLGEVTLSKEERDTVARFDVVFAYSLPLGDIV